ncbi:MAG: hypothetical protein IPJ88_02545 [Myxococcales bacterium]|nr:MAG: hypothetical protein IPJ88_02545 [Myxococcales bacterium]
MSHSKVPRLCVAFFLVILLNACAKGSSTEEDSGVVNDTDPSCLFGGCDAGLNEQCAAYLDKAACDQDFQCSWCPSELSCGGAGSSCASCDALTGGACDSAPGCQFCGRDSACGNIDAANCVCSSATSDSACTGACDWCSTAQICVDSGASCDLSGENCKKATSVLDCEAGANDCVWCGASDACFAAGTTCGSPRKVFISSVAYTGNMGGLSGADGLCQTLAGNAGLSGTYKAWLSAPNNSVASRFNTSEMTYQLVDGTKIAIGWSELISGKLRSAIDTDENNNTSLSVSSASCDGKVSAWTGTDATGQSFSSSLSCNGWTSTGSESAVLGEATATSSAWTVSCTLTNSPCSRQARIYCIEQAD